MNFLFLFLTISSLSFSLNCGVVDTKNLFSTYYKTSIFENKIDKIEKENKDNPSLIEEKKEEYFSEIQRDITLASIIVGKEEGFDILMDKRALIYGGKDITENVKEFLNNTKSSELKGIKIIKDTKVL